MKWPSVQVKAIRPQVLVGFIGLLVLAGIAVCVNQVPVATAIVGGVVARIGDLIGDD